MVDWQSGDNELSFELSRPGQARGAVELALPSEPTQVELNGKPISWENAAPGRYLIPLNFDRKARLRLAWKSP